MLADGSMQVYRARNAKPMSLPRKGARSSKAMLLCVSSRLFSFPIPLPMVRLLQYTDEPCGDVDPMPDDENVLTD
jgi:hypothetical protein